MQYYKILILVYSIWTIYCYNNISQYIFNTMYVPVIQIPGIFCITLSLYLFSIKPKGRCWTRDVEQKHLNIYLFLHLYLKRDAKTGRCWDVLRCWDVVQYPRCCTKIWRCPGMYRRCLQHLPYFQISVKRVLCLFENTGDVGNISYTYPDISKF